MNITFTIMAHGFEKAAAVEKALKAINIPYETKTAKPVATSVKRPKVDKIKLAAILLCIDKNPNEDDKGVARMTGVGRNTVNRIRRGLHALQQDAEEIR